MQKLPLKKELDITNIFKKSTIAHKFLGELNGISNIIPNKNILINSLVLQEAKDSSQIENIITTHDEIYLSQITNEKISKEVKEVQKYKDALLFGYEQVKNKKYITLNDIIKIQTIIVGNNAGIRKQIGTVLKNDKIIYTPPQHYEEIIDLLQNLIEYINNDEMEHYDYLIKMAIIHYQFEIIHPFYDGNGRTGRILNVLYLTLKDLIDLPILYLSGYIIKHKNSYYKLLQEVRTKDKWNEWIMFMLDGIIQTSNGTINLIKDIQNLMIFTKKELKTKLPKIYNKDILEVLFLHPYTKIEFLEKHLNITRKTASKYLKEIEKIGILKEKKIGRNRYFINIRLFDLLKKPII